MIIGWFLQLLSGFVSWLLSLFPSVPVPSWVTDTGGYVATLVGYASSMGAWIPWSLLVTVSAVVLACVAAGFAIKLVRIVASFLTAGGGSAA